MALEMKLIYQVPT